MNLPCGKCGQVLSCVALIWYEVAGDEYCNSYFFCQKCDAYTLEVYHDRFLGESHANMHNMSRQEGDALVALISRCPEPSEKRCKCPAHAKFA